MAVRTGRSTTSSSPRAEHRGMADTLNKLIWNRGSAERYLSLREWAKEVGSYDPMPNYNGEKLVGLNLDRIKYWMGVGAQPTVAVYKLLSLAGVVPIHPRLQLEASRKRETSAEATGKISELSPDVPTSVSSDSATEIT